MPCKIPTELNHHFKVGKCEGSVCQTTSAHDILKRRKRFICLYSLVKLFQAKKKLKQLKQAIEKLEREAAERSSVGANSLGGQAAGGNEIGRSGSSATGNGVSVGNGVNDFSRNAFVGTGRTGSPGMGGSSRSTGEIRNSGLVGGPVSGGLGSASSGISEMDRFGLNDAELREIGFDTSGDHNFAGSGRIPNDPSNRRTGIPTDEILSTMGSSSNGNGPVLGMDGLATGSRVFNGNNLDTAGLDATSSGNVGAGITSLAPLLPGNGRRDAGSSVSDISNRSRFRGGDSGVTESGTSGARNGPISTTGGVGSRNGVAGFINRSLVRNGPTEVASSRLHPGIIIGSGLGTSGEVVSSAASASNTETFPSTMGIGPNGIDFVNPGSGSSDSATAVTESTRVDSTRTGTSVASSFPGSVNGVVTNTAGSSNSISDRSAAHVSNAAVTTTASGSGANTENVNAPYSTSVTNVNENADTARAADGLFTSRNTGNRIVGAVAK